MRLEAVALGGRDSRRERARLTFARAMPNEGGAGQCLDSLGRQGSRVHANGDGFTARAITERLRAVTRPSMDVFEELARGLKRGPDLATQPVARLGKRNEVDGAGAFPPAETRQDSDGSAPPRP